MTGDKDMAWVERVIEQLEDVLEELRQRKGEQEARCDQQ